MSEVTFELQATGTAEVIRPEHADACVEAHPNQPCPGYPHAQEG